jgi:general secretion pathway protein D
VLPVHHLQAKELAERLTEILGKSVASPQAAGPGGAAPPVALGAVKLFPDERAGRLLVVASDAAYARVAAVAQRLDIAVRAGASRVHVYRCKHADCDAVATLLGTLSGVDVSRGPAPPDPPHPHRRPRGARARRPRAPPARPPRSSTARCGSPPIPPPIRCWRCSSLDDFRTLQRLAEEIDVPRKQVFIEATIMEVLVSKDRSIGGGYHLGRATGTGCWPGAGSPRPRCCSTPNNLGSALVGLSGIALGAPLKGVAEALGLPATKIPSVGAFIHLLQSDQNINLVANPHLLITNNHEGEISVGQKIPFQSGITSVPGAGGHRRRLRPHQPRGRGPDPDITPHVNDENLIRLEINQEMSEVAGRHRQHLRPHHHPAQGPHRGLRPRSPARSSSAG